MINYNHTAFGLGTLLRIQGSACYRACFVGLFSVLVFYLIRWYWDAGPEYNRTDELRHPYAVGVLVTALTFLLVFRCQAAYGRYWEAAGNVSQMMSKWMDAVTHCAIYHLQCDHYKAIKPPTFFEYPKLNAYFLSRDREEEGIENALMTGTSYYDPKRIGSRATSKSIECLSEKHINKALKRTPSNINVKKTLRSSVSNPVTDSSGSSSRPTPRIFEGEPRLDGGWGLLFDDGKATFYDPKKPDQDAPPKEGFGSVQGGRSPPLFLQELAHLTSLLVAVAFSTLRNDIEGSESPLDIYVPGSEWPEVDPVMTHGESAFEPSYWSKFMMFLGVGRSAEDLIRYNASRPMPVIGGVSAAEIRFLQLARGPYAKTQLCWQWLSEFIIREHLAGSTGLVGPPIISRIIQFLGDGMIYYNHSRKIMVIPFPFPHAQLSVAYILVAIPAIAFLMDQYTDLDWVGATLTFLTVTCLSGIHEVARELENPFRNVPNEIPLVTLMAQFNEGLLTMYAGFHPDFFWRESAEHYNKMPMPSTSSSHSKSSQLPNGHTNPSSSSSAASPPKPKPTVSSADTPEKTFVNVPCSANVSPKVETKFDKEPAPAVVTPSPKMELQLQELLRRLEEQERELERLRVRVGDDDEKKVGC